MVLDIVTGDRYPVRHLTYEVKNISLPRVVINQLRITLRDIHSADRKANSFDKCCKRESSDTGCFEFETAALHVASMTTAHLRQFRKDPFYWRSQTALQETDHKTFSGEKTNTYL